jgi:hypothetical protein
MIGKWFSTYLTGRTQAVVVKGCKSSSILVKSGVPQGSQLGPLCFILFINDIFNEFKCKSLGFADDLKLFKVIQNVKDCEYLQEDLNRLFKWSEKWKMSLNFKKCVVLRIGLKRKPINYDYRINCQVLASVKTHCDLGVVLDQKLTFNSHVEGAVAGGRKLLGMIKRFGRGLSCRALVIVYVAFVRAKLEYASVIWNSIGKVNADKLEAVQKCFLRYICYIDGICYDDFNYKYICNHFNLPMLSHRCTYYDLLFLFKSVNSIFNSQSLFSLHVPGRRSRQSRTFHQPGGRVSFSQQCLVNRIPSLFNSAYSNMRIFNISTDRFKRSARSVCF